MEKALDTREKLLSEARLLPSSCGVYKMYNKSDKVIYVGKSKNLKSRVSQYFQNHSSHNLKTQKMVEQVVRFECVFTDTENEALVLENEIIKLFIPKFNIRLKDDKSYPYIVVTQSEAYPRIRFVRSPNLKKSKGDKYFGPYSSSSAVYDIIDTVNKLFKLPTCKLKFPEDINKSRPCLNFHIDKCMGVCTGNVSESEYADIIKSVVMFLKADYEAVLKNLEKKMKDSAEALDFEKAVIYRNLINSIKNLRSKQKIIFNEKTERDLFGFYSDDLSSCIAVTIIREGRIIDNKRFLYKNDEILDADTFASFLAEFYKSQDFLPKEILMPREYYIESIDTVCDYLSELNESKVKVIVPERGRLKEALKMSCENAKEFSLHQRSLIEKNNEKLIELASILHLEIVPETIEAYDVSNSSGEHTVAGMITVKNGVFYKKNYKHFNIRESFQDDYSATKEALRRRFKRYQENPTAENWCLPDLILMDGGVGHVNCAQEVLEEFALSIPVFGMVKDEHHKTRTLVSVEGEISISHNSKIYNFIYGIQEEVHRFTFSSMDKNRRKSMTRLSIENINGIGPSKAQSLIKHFKSIKNIKKAKIDELTAVKGISKKDAEEIINYYNQM